MRVARILDGSPAGAKHGWTVAVALVAVFAGACAIAGAKAPRLITFTDGVSANSIASSRVDSGVSNFSIKAAPVTLREPAPAVHSAALRAKPTKHVVHRMKRNDAPLIAQLQAPPIEEILHLAKLSPVPLIPAQTVFVMFESRSLTASGAPMYQLRVWRLTVWHPVIDPEGKKVPPKQI